MTQDVISLANMLAEEKAYPYMYKTFKIFLIATASAKAFIFPMWVNLESSINLVQIIPVMSKLFAHKFADRKNIFKKVNVLNSHKVNVSLPCSNLRTKFPHYLCKQFRSILLVLC